MRYPSFALLIASLLFAGCSSLLDRHEIAGSWELREAAIEAGAIASGDMAFTSEDLSFRATLVFRRGSSLYGQACNHFNGTYAVPAEGQLTVRDWLQTAMLCLPEGSPKDIIDRAFTGLSVYSPVDVVIEGDIMVITYEGVRLEFVRVH